MENIALIGIDLGKNSFHIHCQDHRGKAVYRKKFTRPKLIEFLATCPATTIAMEACGGSQPAFNLSHDQTLQFKFDARELNFVMNYVFTQRLGIHFSSEDVKNPCHFECPHRLSDKLLKSSATALSALSRGGVYYAFLFQSQP